jgi:hypothetical protein
MQADVGKWVEMGNKEMDSLVGIRIVTGRIGRFPFVSVLVAVVEGVLGWRLVHRGVFLAGDASSSQRASVVGAAHGLGERRGLVAPPFGRQGPRQKFAQAIVRGAVHWIGVRGAGCADDAWDCW